MTLQLRARFLIAGGLLLATTVATGAWSVMSSREVSRVVGTTVADDQRAIDEASTLAGVLEREDDALLLALTDPTHGRTEISRQRQSVQESLRRVRPTLDLDERKTLDDEIVAYHTAVDALATAPDSTRYLDTVNPKLRRAIATIDQIQDRNSRSSLAIAEWARDHSTSSLQIVSVISAIGLLLLIGIAFHFGRAVVQPLRTMSRAVDAIRRNDFTGRIAVGRADEVGKLGDGLNRMSDELAEFRRANIAEVIRAKETLEATLAALPDAVIVVGADRVITSANPRAHALLGNTLEGKPLEVLALPAIDLNAEVDLRKAIELDGKQLLPRIVPANQGAVLVLSEVTELVRLDQLRIEMVAVASHELRTPLTTLRMTVLMLQEHAAAMGDRERALITTAVGGVQQLSTLVDEFLSLTQIEAGQLRLTLAPVSADDLVDRAIRELASAAAEAGVTIEQHRAPATINGDASRLAIVLGNLLSNALKYSPRGSVVGVHVRETGDTVEIAVTDQGPGVPVEHRERVFERFFRIEHTRSPRPDEVMSGVGIGLYIARQIVVAHGGRIRCEAADGGGARFVVVLPSGQFARR